MAFEITMMLNLTVFFPALLILLAPSVHSVRVANEPILPAPPRQNAPWNPPAGNLPKHLVEDTNTLFSQGLADPRGCDYRVVKVRVGGSQGSVSEVVTTHAWVLPANTASKSRFAVCWNGLVYKVLYVGGPADVTADIEHDMRSISDANAAIMHYPSLPFSEADAVSYSSMFPIKVCFLLRTGHAKLAGLYWKAWAAGPPADIPSQYAGVISPYFQLSEDWTWSLYDRAVRAHMIGEHKIAVESAAALQTVLPGITSKLAKRGESAFATPWHSQNGESLKALLDDEARRIPEAPRPHPKPAQDILFIAAGSSSVSAPHKDNRSAAEKARWLKILMSDLEDVSAAQMSLPGGPDLASDPVVQELAGMGDMAVEPLLDALENDNRLTRSVGWGAWRGYYFVPVRSAAYTALCGILQTTFEASGNAEGSPAERHKLAGAIRSFWLKHKKLSGPELWRNTLLDDTSTLEQWQIAAAHIVQPDNVQFEGGAAYINPVSLTWSSKVLLGESLRKASNPSITDLLVKRAVETENIDNGTFALALAAWDGKNHLPELRRYTQYFQEHGADDGNGRKAQPIAAIISLYLTRMELRDPSAVPDYAAWIRTITPKICEGSAALLFQPAFVKHDGAVDASISQMFGPPNSPWALIHGKKPVADIMYDLNALVDSPLTGRTGFRDFLLRNLEIQVGAGRIRSGKDGWFEPVSSFCWQPQVDARTGDPYVPRAGKVVSYRVCDLVANAIGNIAGAPECELYWPIGRRNAAVARCKAFLKSYGAHILYDPIRQDHFSDVSDPKAHIIFAPLKRPATATDVAAGRAIFTLPGHPRTVSLPAAPIAATWIGRNDDNVRYLRKHHPHEMNQEIDELTSGYIWQAEEVWENGHWKRYYGFVGKHAIVKLPAETVKVTDKI